jgi:hypothetical protein
MTKYTLPALSGRVDAALPDNTSGTILPAGHRQLEKDIIDSLVTTAVEHATPGAIASLAPQTINYLTGAGDYPISLNNADFAVNETAIIKVWGSGATATISAGGAETVRADQAANGSGAWAYGETSTVHIYKAADNLFYLLGLDAQAGTPDSFQFAASDETTALTTGTGKITLPLPKAFKTLERVWLDVVTAPTAGPLTIDVNAGGTTIFASDPSIADGATSVEITGATTPALAVSTLAKRSLISVDIVAVTGSPAGLKVTFEGRV